MKKIIYRKFLKDCLNFFIIALISTSIIIWVFHAVNYLDRYIYRRVCFKANGAERKLSGVFSSALDPIKEKEYQTKNVTKIFRATIFGLRNNTIEDMPAGWDINDVEDLDWFGELVKKPVDILDNF